MGRWRTKETITCSGQAAANAGDFFVLSYDPMDIAGYGRIPGVETQSAIGPLLPLVFGVGSSLVFGVALYLFEVGTHRIMQHVCGHVYRRVHRNVFEHVYIDMCVAMCVDICA